MRLFKRLSVKKYYSGLTDELDALRDESTQVLAKIRREYNQEATTIKNDLTRTKRKYKRKIDKLDSLTAEVEVKLDKLRRYENKLYQYLYEAEEYAKTIAEQAGKILDIRYKNDKERAKVAHLRRA